VWYVPSFSTIRLLSVKALCAADFKVLFDKLGATCFEGEDPIFEAQSIKGSYIVDEAKAFVTDGGDDSEVRFDFDQNHHSDLKESAVELVHRRLGHTNFKDITKLANHSTGLKCGKRIVTVGRRACECCLAGKLKESFSKTTDSRRQQRGRRLHGDSSGILPISIRNYRYFLLVIDDASRACWVKLLKSKDTKEVFPALMEVIETVESETGDKVVEFRCDNAKGEFGPTFQAKLKSRGTAIEPCPAYKHAMNGVAEKYIDLIKIKMRSILYQAKLAKEFWCLAVEHSVWIKNRIPTAALPLVKAGGRLAIAVTPYEAWYERLPNFDRLWLCWLAT